MELNSPLKCIDNQLYTRLVRFRRMLHLKPELSGVEYDTSLAIEHELKRLHVPYIKKTDCTGIIAEIPGAMHSRLFQATINKDSSCEGPLKLCELEGTEQRTPVIAIRGDMDALPIVEETELPFSSTRHGIMHACGHDGHTTICLGAIEMLLGHTQKHGELPVPVRFIFQPAEETGQGARQMIQNRAVEDVEFIVGLHLDRHYPVGCMAVQEGCVNAAATSFSIMIKGRPGHGARPHEATDAIVIGCLLVTAIQTIVSREVDPAEPSVISVGEFHAGSAPNCIAGQAQLRGTIRSISKKQLDEMIASLRRIVGAVGQMHNAKIRVTLGKTTPPVINTGYGTRLAKQAAKAILGPDAVVDMRTVNMGGEDFAWYLRETKGVFVRLGGTSLTVSSSITLQDTKSKESSTREGILKQHETAHLQESVSTNHTRSQTFIPSSESLACNNAIERKTSLQASTSVQNSSLGSRDTVHLETTFPAHSSKFNFDEQALAVGTAFMYEMAIKMAKQFGSVRSGREQCTKGVSK